MLLWVSLSRLQVRKALSVDTCSRSLHIHQHALIKHARLHCFFFNLRARPNFVHIINARAAAPDAGARVENMNKCWMYDRSKRCLYGLAIWDRKMFSICGELLVIN
jgi:hypothetical protein